MSDPTTFRQTTESRIRVALHWTPFVLGTVVLATTALAIGYALRVTFWSVQSAAPTVATDTPASSPTTDPIYRKVAELQGTRIARDLTPRPTSTPEETPAPTMTVVPPLDCAVVTPGPVPIRCVWSTPTPIPAPPPPTCATPMPLMACLVPTATQIPTSSEVMVE